MKETAFAKINLALHVRRRREDGYHELETLFAFVDAGDELTARKAESDCVETFGEFAEGIDDPFDNLVARALGKLPRPDGLAISLEKNLPVAAGLGGGSADAGAVFRIVRDHHGLPDDWHARASALGADVPACVDSLACIGRGTGTELEPIENDLAGTPVLLVNPRIAVPTGPIFKAWSGVDGGPLVGKAVREIAVQNRNDLEPIAIAQNSQISEVLNVLAGTGGFLQRMSGSGATCFALYDDHAALVAASERIGREHPEWWQMQGKLR